MPSLLANKKEIINPKNKDDRCFLWAVTIAENPPENHPERIGKEIIKLSEKYNLKGISFPMSLENIGKFENLNNLAINVFGWEKEVYPLRISKIKNKTKINLLYLKTKEKNHFCWIKNLDKLLSTQVSKHKEPKVFCERCLNHFPNDEALKIHKESCEQFEFVKIEMPKEGETCRFKNFNREMKIPFVVYADFESIVEKVSSGILSSKENQSQFSKDK